MAHAPNPCSCTYREYSFSTEQNQLIKTVLVFSKSYEYAAPHWYRNQRNSVRAAVTKKHIPHASKRNETEVGWQPLAQPRCPNFPFSLAQCRERLRNGRVARLSVGERLSLGHSTDIAEGEPPQTSSLFYSWPSDKQSQS